MENFELLKQNVAVNQDRCAVAAKNREDEKKVAGCEAVQ